MATLALGVVGAGIGTVTGVGAGTGWLVGTTLGRVLFPEQGGGSTGPLLSDLKITGASYGATIPRIYGTMRLAGNIIWASDLTAEAVESSSGGKGGAGSSQSIEGYIYAASFAVAIGAGEMASLLKIWADGKVIYDASAAGEVIASDVRFRFYPGDETQLPDSIMTAAEGAENVPAYRGISYLVFDQLPLSPYGNRLPNIEVLVTTVANGAYPLMTGEIASIEAGSLSYDPIREHLFTYEVVGGVNTVRKINAFTLNEEASGVIGTDIPELLDAGRGFSRDRNGDFWMGTGAGTLAGRQIHRVSGDALTTVASADLPSGVGAVTFSTGVVSPLTGARFQVAGSQQSYQVVVFDADLQVVDTIGTSSRVCTGALTDEEEVAWIALSGWLTGPQVSDLEIVRVTLFGSQSPDGTSYSVESDIYTIDTADLTPLGGTGSETNTITRLVAYLPESRELVFQNSYRLFKWSMTSHGITVYRDVGLNGDLSLENIHNGSELFYIEAGQYATYLSAETLEQTEQLDLREFDGVTSDVAGVYDVTTDSLLAVNDDFGIKRLYLRRGNGRAADLAAIVADLCARAGLNSGEYNFSELDREVPGFIVNRPMAIADALAPLSHYGFFDIVESGHKLNFIPRNKNAEFEISHEDMLAAPNVKRLQESELPEQISLNYLASDAGYQAGSQTEKRAYAPVATMFGRNQVTRDLPMALTADQARQTAEQTLYAAWAERQLVSMALPLRYLALDPADVVSVTLAEGSATTRLAEAHFGADMSLEVEAVSLTSLAYESSISGHPGSGYQQVLIQRGTHAELFILDLPLLRDEDATAGAGSRFYFAMDGYQAGWTGGALYSAYDEVSYELEGTLSGEVAWGIALTALPDVNSPWQTDRTNHVDIRFVNGGNTLENIIESALLNGGNTLLLGGEIIQFATATVNADGSYRLETLLRGRRGTEVATGAHIVGEKAILLTRTTIGGGFVPLSDLHVPRRWKAMGAGRLLEEVPFVIHPLSGTDLKPYAPVHLSGTRTEGDLVLSWQRRTRVGGGALNGDVPLSEATERYELVLSHGGEGITKYVRDQTSYSYSLDQFNADFGVSETEVPELSVTLYQLSEAIGRGYPATEII